MEVRGTISRLLAICGVLIAAFYAVSLLVYPLARDQNIYSVVASALLDGRPPYLEAWDFKPPGIFFVYGLAQALLGTSSVALRAFELLGLFSMVAAFVILSRRFVESSAAGWLAGLLAIAGHVELEYWNTGQPESFGGVLLAWAIVCATYEPHAGKGLAPAERRRFMSWASAAALYSMAALLKPPLGAGILVSFAFVIAARRAMPAAVPALRRYGLPLAAFGLGGALPLLAVWLYFTATGALDAMVETLFVFAPHYTALRFHPASIPGFAWKTIRIWLAGLSPYNTVGLAALLMLRPLGPRERSGMLHVLGVTACSLLGVIVQAKFFSYHFGTAVLLTALPAGWGLYKVFTHARTSLQIGGAAAVLIVIALGGLLPVFSHGADFWTRTGMRIRIWRDSGSAPALENRLYSKPDFNFVANRLAAQWIADNTAKSDAVYVWGFAPGIYRQSGRRPASRYIYNVPQRAEWSQAAARAQLMKDLEGDPPAVVVVESGDIIPWVTGTLEDSYKALYTFPELMRFVGGGYRPAARLMNLQLYSRTAR